MTQIGLIYKLQFVQDLGLLHFSDKVKSKKVRLGRILAYYSPFHLSRRVAVLLVATVAHYINDILS